MNYSAFLGNAGSHKHFMTVFPYFDHFILYDISLGTKIHLTIEK